ncbi:MAG: hypothetical protein ACRBCS_01685 [Cellvibrionaceae bacterium]
MQQSSMMFKTLKYAMPIVATIIFFHQLYKEKTSDLSTWKGGGMGMFAAWDRPSKARYTHMFIETSEGDKLPLIGVTHQLGRLNYKVTAEPSDSNFNHLGEALTAIKWQYSDKKIPMIEQNEKGERRELSLAPQVAMHGKNPVNADAIIIEFGKIHYDIDKQEIKSVLVKERRYEF